MPSVAELACPVCSSPGANKHMQSSFWAAHVQFVLGENKLRMRRPPSPWKFFSMGPSCAPRNVAVLQE